MGSHTGIYIGEDFHHINQCVNSFQEDQVKRLYKVDA